MDGSLKLETALICVCACVPPTVALCSAFSKNGDGASPGELVYLLLGVSDDGSDIRQHSVIIRVYSGQGAVSRRVPLTLSLFIP